MKFHAAVNRLERACEAIDCEDLAHADPATLQRLRSLGEALAAAVATEQEDRAIRAHWMCRHPAWTLPGFRPRTIA